MDERRYGRRFSKCFTCPSALKHPGNNSPLVYVANCGNQGDGTPNVYCGVMTNNYTTSYSLEDVADGDGTATTLLYGEKAVGVDFEFQKIWDFNFLPTSGGNSSFPVAKAFSNATNDTVVGGAFLDGYPAFGLPATEFPVWKPLLSVYNLRSPHTGGSVVAFCDGHTYFLKNDINPDVYTQLVTSNNGRLPSGHAYKRSFLNEGSY